MYRTVLSYDSKFFVADLPVTDEPPEYFEDLFEDVYDIALSVADVYGLRRGDFRLAAIKSTELLDQHMTYEEHCKGYQGDQLYLLVWYRLDHDGRAVIHHSLVLLPNPDLIQWFWREETLEEERTREP